MRGSVRMMILASILAAFAMAPSAAKAQAGVESTNAADSCVKAVGDINGDGLTDYAASPRVPHGSPVVYLLFGRSELSAAAPDARYIRRHAAVVLRGATAVPFICANDTIRIASDIRLASTAVSKPKRRRTDSAIGRPASYTMIDLDPMMPAFSIGYSSSAKAINERGQIVGRSFAPTGDRAFIYDNGEVRDLGTLGGHISDARDINDTGEIVGYSLTGESDRLGFVNEAFLSDGHSLTSLGIRWSSAEGINNADQIVGEMQVQPDVDLNHAFLYQQGSVTDLGSLTPLNASAHSVALAINDKGQIVGESDTFIPGILDPSIRHFATHAFLYENGAMHDVGSLGAACGPFPEGGERCFDQASATAINNSGRIVGFSLGHAFSGTEGSLRGLGTLGGSSSWAYGVNDSGQVVGVSLNSQEQYVPFLFDQGVMYNLNSLIVNPSGTLPFAAYAINNFGQIAGNHHLLNPKYEEVAPGQHLSFTATLGETLTFEYWLARRNLPACHAIRNRLRLEMKIDLSRPDGWVPVAEIPGCEESTDWRKVTITIGGAVPNTMAGVHIRVRESGNSTDPVVYLRHLEIDSLPESTDSLQ
jgi:probable HAF family extracellular repeat protein